MKKMITTVLFILFIGFIAGCGSEGGKQEANPNVDEIITAVQEQIAADLKANGVEEDMLVDGNLLGYITLDLLNVNEEDPLSSIFAEKLELDLEQLEAGGVVAAAMNVNSDEIIVLKAKDEAHVQNLQAALDKELEAQDQTWSMYLPDQHEKVKNNIIKTNGKYLIYVTYGQPEKIEEIFNGFFK